MPFETILSALAPPLCWACGGAVARGLALCAACRARVSWLGQDVAVAAGVEVWAPVAYTGPARALVRGLKFGRAAGLASPMAAQMAANAPPGMFETTLVPVPMAARRRRRRGFNQAERLARALAERTGAPVADCLLRRGDGAPQVGRGREERLGSLAGAVRVAAAEAAPLRCLLVDDVVTTGATLAACSAALRSAGARDVAAVAYARTPAR